MRRYLTGRWPYLSRAKQVPAPDDWTIWMLLGGRGSGKTRAGAEWVRGMATGDPFFSQMPVSRIALVGETYGDAREVMVEGESGLLAVHNRQDRPVWISSRRRLEWSNGCVAQLFSSEDPDALRGPQFGAAWCDELAKWTHVEETWNMLQFGLRLGAFPQQVITTTPRPINLVRRLVEDERTLLTRMPTGDNMRHLASGFMERVVGLYRGTRLGRQELDGEIVEDRADALWQRQVFERHRLQEAPVLQRVVVAIDPPVSGKATSDACGLVAAGLGPDGRCYVLADRSIRSVSPERWAKAAVRLFTDMDADLVVVETNQGGDMAESVLRHAAPNLPVRQVRASRGKWIRAEPVAHLYERGLVSHVGFWPELEDEMCDFGLDGLSDGRSPDRLDALVWALNELMLRGYDNPRARQL